LEDGTTKSCKVLSQKFPHTTEDNCEYPVYSNTHAR